MPKFIIKGPAKLSGEIDVKGAKNAALKIIPASILSKEKITITNVPEIEDINRAIQLLEDLGAIIKKSKNKLEIDTSKIKKTTLNPKIADKFRSSIMFVAPMLARFGEVKFPHPGGCVIGAGGRAIDIFLDGFKAFNVDVEIKKDHYHLKTKKLKATNFFFPIVSVTATESFIMAAVLAEGTTTLNNCAMEPEITALANYFKSQGAKIEGIGSPNLTIEGVPQISASNFEVIPDRIETGSFIIMAAVTNSEITIKNCNPEHIRAFLTILKKIGVKFEEAKDWIKVKKSGKIKAYGIKTHEYPGFPTDLQPPYTVLMTQAEGNCMIHETIYDRRLIFTDLLCQMGADITLCDPHRAVINGPSKLHQHKLTSPDLRAGIALVIASLCAEGTTEIDNIYQIDRGYENIEKRLKKLGADIKRIN